VFLSVYRIEDCLEHRLLGLKIRFGAKISTLSNVRLPNRQGLFDVRIEGGAIAAIEPHCEEPISDATLDGGGELALPAFADGHVHLDKTLIGLDWIPHQGADDVKTRIAVEKELRRRFVDSAPRRARLLADQLLRYGTTAVRTHVDIDEQCRLRGLENILELREERASLLDMQVVAFPQSGLWPSATVVPDLEKALQLGVDAIGGVDPTVIDGDPEKSLDTIFALAERYDVCVDLHLHEGGEMGAAVIMGMCARTKRAGLGGRVVVSHAFCLASLPEPRVDALADFMAETGVAAMTSAPGANSLIPVARLSERGVRVITGSDNIRDAWSPFGKGDMLERACLLAYRADLRSDEGLEFAFECVSRATTEALGFLPRGLAVGNQADFVLVNSFSVAQAVCDAPTQRRVIRKGQILILDR
jgi:cytosine/creatinine deaminase